MSCFIRFNSAMFFIFVLQTKEDISSSMKKISIIVPVYNVELYLERCILSIVGQNASEEYYELIVVNDGSTDRSRDILIKLHKKYPFIKIVDKPNGGLSSARNEGLKYAVADFIFFLDSDDWIASDSLSFLLNWIEKYNADIYLFGINKTDGQKSKPLISTLATNDKVLKTEDYLCANTLRSSAWQGLFSRELFIQSELTFKDGFISEDDDFTVRIFSIAKTVVCNNKIVYYYFQRKGSITKNKNLAKKQIDDKLIMHKELDNYIQNFQGKMRQGLQRKMNFLAIDIIRLLIRNNQDNQTIECALAELKSIGYYPLKKADYSSKYKMFRLLTYFPWCVKSGKIFKNYV